MSNKCIHMDYKSKRNEGYVMKHVKNDLFEVNFELKHKDLTINDFSIW